MEYTGERNSDGRPHGQGTMTFDDGATYTGEHRDGLWHGQGTFTFADGETYTGEFMGCLPVAVLHQRQRRQ